MSAAGHRLGVAAEAIREQQRWIDDHGGCLSGYVERYGDPDFPVELMGWDGQTWTGHHGDGGTAIYQADMSHLDHLVGMWQARGGRTGRRAVDMGGRA